MSRLLSLSEEQVWQFHRDVQRHQHHQLPGAVRASANRGTSLADIAALGAPLRDIAAEPAEGNRYRVDAHGDYVMRDIRPQMPTG